MAQEPKPGYTFRGRIKPKEEKPSVLATIELPHTRKAFVYKRLSTHEQIKKSIFSMAMQDALKDLAKEDGYPASMIVEENRDLGLSGTLGSDARPGLANLIQHIETGQIESLYVVHISRLFRDQTLIDGWSFGELCKKQNVIIIMPDMRLNLADKMHMRIYRMELEKAADELELLKLRMGGARELKAKQGYYVTGSVPVGYVVYKEKNNKRSGRYRIYEPHAAIVRQVFDAFVEANFSRINAARALKDVRIPFFPSELQHMMKISAVNKMKSDKRGFLISPKFVARMVSNPAYIGWWVWGGNLIGKNNHPAIISEDLFWSVQERLEKKRHKGRAVYTDTPILYRLLYCTRHTKPVLVHCDLNGDRYRCHGDQSIQSGEHYCFSSNLDVFDGPISEYVIGQCSHPEYSQKIMLQLRQGYQEAKSQAEANQRELGRLTAEIEKLKENLAYTRSQNQAEIILEMIDQRRREKEALSQLAAYPAGRIGAAMDIENAGNFESTINDCWPTWPDDLRNEFLRLVLDLILVTPENRYFRARVIWKNALEQELLIHRPAYQTTIEHRWVEEELQLLRIHFATAPWPGLLRMLPMRTYGAISDHAHSLGLKRAKKPYGRRDPFTQDEDDIVLRVAREEMALADALEQVDRTPNAILVRMEALGYPASRLWKEKSIVRWEVVQ